MIPRTWLRGLIGCTFLGATGALAAGFWIPAKATLAQVLLERSWQAVRGGSADAKPWPWADTSPVAQLSIPALDLRWIVLAGASGRNLAFAPTQLDGSAAPGAAGVMVVAAHRDTHFARLGDIAAGTEVLVEDSRGIVHRYEVTATHVVDSRTARIRLDADRPVLMLSTCYPFDALGAGGPLRFLVEAEMAQNANASVPR